MHPYFIPVWKQSPLLRVLVSLIIGIISQYYLDFSSLFITALLLSSSLFYFLFYNLPLQYRFKYQYWQSAFLIIMIASFGMLLTRQQDLRNSSSFFLNRYKKGDNLILKIESQLTEKQNSYSTTASVLFIRKNKKLISTEGKLNLVFKKNDTAKSIKYGDLILVNKSVESIKNSGNPGSFDNKRYNAFQQTYHQCYLNGTEFVACGINQGSSLNNLVFLLRDKIISVLQKNINNKNGSLGIAEALLIGYKNDLDKAMVQAYSNTGVVHIIAISGLHLGLIYMLLFWLLERLPFIKRNRFAKAMILLVCLWIFSLMTGASASVLRSAVMFTCIIIGNMLNRKSSIYNSLAASAFLLLCYNPYFIWDVGFQLSYFAIIGIVWLQKPIQQLFTIDIYLFRKIWEMTSITIAAQIITFPVCLFYFHQFPTYFLFSNLIAVPLSTLILFEEIFLICCSGLHSIGSLTGQVIDTSIILMNKWIVFINKLPAAVIDFIYADLHTTVVLYAMIASFILFLMRKNKHYLKWSLLLFTIFSSLQSMAKHKWYQQRFFIVYNTTKFHCMDLVDGRKYINHEYCFPIKNNAVFHFYPDASRKFFRIIPDKNLIPGIGNNNLIIKFYHKKIAVIDSQYDIVNQKPGLIVDYLVLTSSSNIDIKAISEKIKFQKIIFDSSNSLWKIRKWKKECDSLHLHCFSVIEEGPYFERLR